jgi:hypothetical protein
MAAPIAAAGLVSLLTLTACQGGDDPVTTLEQKQSADAQAPRSATAGQRERFIPTLRKYHDRAAWPSTHDLTPEQMWDGIAPHAARAVLDNAAAESHVAVLNQCAWALAAIETVKASADTADVRRGLLQSSRLMQGSESVFQTMVDELAVGNVETAQTFVAANQCHEDFG